jgi:hypothetical protein
VPRPTGRPAPELVRLAPNRRRRSVRVRFQVGELCKLFGPLVLIPALPERSATQQAHGTAIAGPLPRHKGRGRNPTDNPARLRCAPRLANACPRTFIFGLDLSDVAVEAA